MDDSEIIEKIEEFGEFLSIGTVISDMVRWIGWVFIKGLAFIVDGLESVTDDVLLIKQFFQNPEIVTFVNTIRPFLYILLAFSLLYTGYLLIFQKKFDREGIAINLFISLIIIMVLSNGMEKANDFTDEAITAINTTQLYNEGEGSLSDNIISRQLTDLMVFDQSGWESTAIEPPNTLPLSMIGHMSISEKLEPDRDELELSSTGKEISQHKLTWLVSEKELIELENSTLMPWKNEYYYRYSINWVTLLATLLVMAFTLFSIAYKLARLSFELTFNYILAILVAPADIHDGQKTKKILQSIMNTFLVIILIFLSMKIYMIGTGYIASELTGLAYVIALIGFSVAVIDGPNIVERLFGIDAGLKNGWGVLAGAYAGGKMLSGATNSMGSMMNKMGGSGASAEGKEGADTLKGQQAKSGIANGKAMSPNDSEEGNGVNAQTAATTTGINKGSANVGGSTDKNGIASQVNDKNEDKKQDKASSPNDGVNLSKEGGIAGQTQSKDSAASNIQEQGNTNGAVVNGKTGNGASPNDVERSNSIKDSNSVPSPNDKESSNVASQGLNSVREGSSSVPSPNDAGRSNASLQGVGNGSSVNGSQSVQKEQGIQNSSVRTDSDIENVTDQSKGNATVRDRNSGGVASPNAPVQSNASNMNGNSQNTSGSQSVQRQQGIQNSSVRTDSDIDNATEQTQGNTTVRNISFGGSVSSSSNGVNTGNTTPSAEGQSRSESSSGSSSRQQNTTNVTRSGGDNVVDENVIVNETQGNSVQGSRNVSSTNSRGSSTTSSFGSGNSGGSVGSYGSNSSVQGTSRSVNQNSTSQQNVQNETIINHDHEQRITQSETTSVNERKRPETYNTGQNSSNSLNKIKNFNRNK